MRISCRGLGASGLGRKLPTHGPLPETAAEFERSDREENRSEDQEFSLHPDWVPKLSWRNQGDFDLWK